MKTTSDTFSADEISACICKLQTENVNRLKNASLTTLERFAINASMLTLTELLEVLGLNNKISSDN